MAIFRMGLLGAGRMGRTHLRALAHSEILRIVAGKNHAFWTNPLQRTIKRGDTSFESGHVEINLIVVLAEGPLERTEALALSNQTIFDRGDTAAEVGHDDL